MIHLGDITKIDGASVDPVEVIIGGSPCQDLSVAGKRDGLSGERSGLFMEQIRIIKEMRKKNGESGANVIIPRFMVWENVPGAFSSNKGEDFRIVLEETARVVEPTTAIPRPEKGKWTNAGAIVGDGWSIAWRVFDAQFWGVPQRRRRIALVADFGGATAPEILFERKGVFWDITQSSTPWKDFASAIAKRFGGANIGFEKVDTENAVDRPAVYDYDKRHDKCYGVDVAPTAKYGTGGGNTPLVYDARCNGEGEIVSTITGDNRNMATDYTALCVRERCGCDGGGKGLLIQKDKSGTLATNNDQFTVCIGNGQANSLKPTEKAGTVNCMHDQQAIITLDRASFNQGKNAQYDFKIDDNGVNSTVVSKGPSAVTDKAKTLDTATRATASHQGNTFCLQSTVRRLTPIECERLQGFPDGWTNIGDYTDTNGKKRKTSDSARYKALGNSIALPSWAWLLERMNRYCNQHTMASLFDGIAGFPLIWETLNGKGSVLWASEIEEFPIAITKYHFGG